MGSTETGSMTTAEQKLTDYLPALVLLMVAGTAIWEGTRLVWFVPAAVQADMAGWYVLVLGGLLALATVGGERPGMIARQRNAPEPERAEPEGMAEVVPPEQPVRDLVVCLLLVAGYAAALPLAGHAITNGVMVLAYLRLVARYGWVRSVLYAVAIDVVVVFGFTAAGLVLPEGPFGF